MKDTDTGTARTAAYFAATAACRNSPWASRSSTYTARAAIARCAVAAATAAAHACACRPGITAIPAVAATTTTA
ncbi:MAG TPA: hypothetical protein VN462_09225, partial [Negativicutes bacterium]|nr:hypothetical protein [Negativicutes bacterium]